MKTKHSNIKFTSECEKNDTSSFLDLKITRSSYQLVTSVFRKATFSGVFTNFKRFFPVGHKFALVYTLFFFQKKKKNNNILNLLLRNF